MPLPDILGIPRWLSRHYESAFGLPHDALLAGSEIEPNLEKLHPSGELLLQ